MATASRFIGSFHTVTRSTGPWTSPLLVRLSQLATQYAVGIPSARALRKYSDCGEPGSMSGVTASTSGRRSRSQASIAGSRGIARFMARR